MALASKPVDLIKESSKLTKEEYETRKAQEEKLKGNSNLVYKPPKCLSKEEQKVYKFLVKELAASEILNNLDITLLETCTDSIIKMQQCRKAIDDYGIIISKEDGTLTKNPAITAYKDYNAIFNICMRELGMSPSSRAKLSIINTEKDKEDPVLKALKAGGS